MSTNTHTLPRFWRALTLLATLSLMACATTTPAERAARAEREVDAMIATYGPACAKLGFTPESDPWRDCILRLNSRDAMIYASRPLNTSCFGHRGFYNCTSY